MLPYYGLILFAGAMYVVTKPLSKDQASKVLVFSVFIATTLLQCLRAECVGVDIIQYLKGYALSGVRKWSEPIFNWEKGFLLFLHILNALNISNQGFIAITSIICQVPVFYFIYKRAEKPALSILIYYSFGLFTFSFSGIRQMISIGISLLAVLALEEGKKKRGFALLVLAVLFHKTAIVNFVIIPLSKLKIKNHMTHVIMVVVLLLEIILAPKIVSIATMIKGNEIEVQYTGAYMNFIFYVIIWFASATFIPQEESWSTYTNLMYVAAMLQCLGMYHMTIARLSYFFAFFESLLIPEIIKKSTNSRTFKTIIYLCCIVFCLFNFYEIREGYLAVYPYIPFWK